MDTKTRLSVLLVTSLLAGLAPEILPKAIGVAAFVAWGFFVCLFIEPLCAWVLKGDQNAE